MYTLYALYFAIFAIFASVLYLICGRIVARFLEWFARRLFKVEIHVEKAQFLALGSIKIITAGTKIEIENIVLQTKWGFPGSRCLLMLCFGHIAVTAAKNGTRVGDIKEPIEEKTPNLDENDVSRNQRLAGIVKFISKYMGIYFRSLDVVLTNQPRSKFNIIVRVVKGVNILCQPNERFLDFSARATKCISSLHHAKEVETDYFQDVTLAEVSFNILLEGSLNPLMSKQFLEDLSIKVNPIRISLGDNLIKNLPQLHNSSKKVHSLNAAAGKESNSTKLSKYLPKNFGLIFTDVDLFVCDEEQRELSIHTDHLSFTASLQDQSWSRIKAMKLLLNGISLKVKARSFKDLMTCSKFMLAVKMQKSESSLPSLWSKIYLASCQCNYVHEEISHWLAFLPLEKREIGNDEKQSFSTTLTKLTKEYSFENNLEVDDMTVCLSENSSNKEDIPVCKAVLASLVTNIQYPATDLQKSTETVNCSARLENAYVYFNATDAETVGIWLEDNPLILPSSRKHLWGRVLELGSSSIKCDIDIEDSTPFKAVMKCDASSLVFEYSQHTKNCLAALLQTGDMYKRLQTHQSGNEIEKTPNTIISLECDVTVHDINLFCVGKCQDGVDSVLARLDVVAVTKGEDGVQIGAHGCKVTRLAEVKNEAYGCAASSNLHHSLLTVTSAVTRLSSSGTTLSLPNIKVDWDIASHMAVHDRISRFIDDSKELKAIFVDSAKDSDVTNDFISNFQLEITTEDVVIEMKTSSVNSFGMQFSGVIKLDQGWIAAESPNVDILFDEKTVFQFKAFSLKKTASHCDVSSVRNTIEGFESKTNKIWLLDAEIYILFPYRFNFGKSLDKLLIVNKMLKQLYRKPRIGIKDPLYADVWLNLKKLSFEIEDDPFEVKLGKNYELLCDEALQWIEREILLDERISEKKKNPGNLLSDKKVDALYESLREKKSKIYIERSVKLYEADRRTRLCCWEFSDVNLMILADESMNGPDKVIPAMKRIDNESPFPSEDIQFSTLWSRFIKGTVSSSTFTLRDYEQPLFLCESFKIFGHLIGAEQAASERAKRTCVVQIPLPWGDQEVTRGMTPLKYFHDLNFDFQKLEMSWGVDIEPAYTMVNIAFEHINKASVDPSLSLPFWDKMRLFLHGRLSMNIKEWQLNWRATRNPYDKSEQLEIEWRNVRFDWTNACFEIFGDFDLFTRTASKYDDCCVLHLPALKFRTDLVWHCRDDGDANNHYNIRPCAPNKLPELPPGQVHDSYVAFRSQNLSLNISFEVDADRLKEDDVPTIILYASTFRWFQNFQAVVWRNVSRPIKKGSIFNRILPKRRPLSRHYRNVGLNLKFPQLSVFYWGSVTKHLGAELHLGTGSLNTVYRVGLSEYKDGLVRRPAATWTITKLDSEIDDVTCYVTCVEEKETENENDGGSTPNQEIPDPDKDVFEPKTLETSKFYLGHVDRLVYKRKELNTSEERTEIDGSIPNNLEDYTHNLVCDNFRGVWTLENRKLTFGLVETYTRSQQLKRDLSADALKFVTVDNKNATTSEASPDVSSRRDSSTRQLSTSQTKLDDLFTKTISGKQEGGDDADMIGSRPRSTTGDVLLDKLVSESADSSKFYVQTEEGTSDETQSSGYALCNSEDVYEQRWHFEFINSQVMLKGIENSGCLLVTAGHAEVLNRLHRPTQSGRKLLNKKTWVGHLENMQYFCTVGSNEDITNTDNLWLDSSTIQARRKNTGIDLTDLSSVLGTGDCIGSLVGNLTNTKLQRIVSRCGCAFYYASFDDELEEGLEAVPASNTPAPSPSSKLRDNQSAWDPVNTFTLKHPVLEICINSAQYALILDIVSNVLLYTEPQKKEVSELEQRMGFYFQLSTAEDLKGTILNAQNTVRACVMRLNELRRALYNLNEIMKEKERMETLDAEISDLNAEKVKLESEVTEMKANLNEFSTELRIMIGAYKDFMTDRVMLSPEKGRNGELMRVVEVFLNHVSWRLTQPDGQLQIVNANIMNLRYINETMTDSSGVHSVEVGNFNMTNLMPNSPYKNHQQRYEKLVSYYLKLVCSDDHRYFEEERKYGG